MKSTSLILSAALLLPIAGRAENAKPATQSATKPARLTLHPSAIASPPLQYRLLPDPADLTPGNAATMYLIGASRNLMSAAGNGGYRKDPDTAYQKELDELETWIFAPPKGIDRARAQHLLDGFQSSLHQSELGARREHCDWDLPERTEGFSTLLPYLSDLRLQSRLLALKARLQIADGKYDEAAHTLQTGFAIARHLNGQTFLVQMLVGTAIADLMLKQVELWITTPGSPNLYWSLTAMPAPYMDFNAAIEHERAGIFYALPHLKEAIDGKLTPEHLAELTTKLVEVERLMVTSEGSPDGVVAAIEKAARNAMWLVQAKTALADMGYNPRKMADMQPSEMIGLWLGLSFERAQQESTKTLTLPLYQALEVEQSETILKKAKERDPGNIMLALMPAYSRARLSLARLDRHIGELRCLEAIRASAAGQKGMLPEKITGLPEIPAPIDPVTGLPYAYRVKDGIAVLDFPVPPGGQPHDGRTDEIQMEK